ncbi:E3 ubiquitin-protein ligase RING1-like [Iris pallida]|uniref:E3 ubiquitin-protein ligase RING1-like n=1 Tax=Iris pallida TaxID=29817 RepID=A0AAX6EHT9_IRIPA|nr:E3 ubiquitin-protein ligase RING1-like [Iris pallida]
MLQQHVQARTDEVVPQRSAGTAVVRFSTLRTEGAMEDHRPVERADQDHALPLPRPLPLGSFRLQTEIVVEALKQLEDGAAPAPPPPEGFQLPVVVGVRPVVDPGQPRPPVVPGAAAHHSEQDRRPQGEGAVGADAVALVVGVEAFSSAVLRHLLDETTVTVGALDLRLHDQAHHLRAHVTVISTNQGFTHLSLFNSSSSAQLSSA